MKRIGASAWVALVGMLALTAAARAQPETPPKRDRVLGESAAEIGTIVYFAFDSTALDQRSRRALAALASRLRRDPKLRVLIAGHADYIGSLSYNFSLAGLRALAVKQYLAQLGVAPERMRVVSFGELDPVSTERAANRRVVFFRERAPTPPTARPAAPPATAGEGVVTAPESEPAETRPLPPQTQVPQTPAAQALQQGRLLTRDGVSFQLGGGVMSFVSSAARDFTSVAGTWEVRLVYGTRTPVAIEAAYFGSASSVNAFGLDSDAYLVGNGLEALGRFNVPMSRRVQAYFVGGIGGTHYDVGNAQFNVSDVRDQDNVWQLPVGAGLSYRLATVLLDARVTLRPTFDDDLMQTPGGGGADLHTWSTTARLGWEF